MTSSVATQTVAKRPKEGVLSIAEPRNPRRYAGKPKTGVATRGQESALCKNEPRDAIGKYIGKLTKGVATPIILMPKKAIFSAGDHQNATGRSVGKKTPTAVTPIFATPTTKC